MNAATKASGLGVVCVLVGVALLEPSPRSIRTLGAAAVLLLITAPVAAHIVGHAAYRAKVPLWGKTRRHDHGDARSDGRGRGEDAGRPGP